MGSDEISENNEVKGDEFTKIITSITSKIIEL